MMLQVLLPESQAQRLVAALHRHRDREIGGILMGEHVAPGQFRIIDLTIQERGGTAVTFVRAVEWLVVPLRRFFRRTRRDYRRFNYLGEWHSHPAMPLLPSTRDCDTMWELVDDPAVGANFVVMLIVHLAPHSTLAGQMYGFLPGRQTFGAELVTELT